MLHPREAKSDCVAVNLYAGRGWTPPHQYYKMTHAQDGSVTSDPIQFVFAKVYVGMGSHWR